MISKRKSLAYRNAFEAVIGTYGEMKTVLGTLSCDSLYKSIARQGSGKSAFNTSIVRPTPVDLIADVENLAKKYLSKEEYQQFVDVYILHKHLEKPNHIRSIGEKLGEAFLTTQIHPLELYFKPKDTR